jgi:hypothetical protein
MAAAFSGVESVSHRLGQLPNLYCNNSSSAKVQILRLWSLFVTNSNSHPIATEESSAIE